MHHLELGTVSERSQFEKNVGRATPTQRCSRKGSCADSLGGRSREARRRGMMGGVRGTPGAAARRCRTPDQHLRSPHISLLFLRYRETHAEDTCPDPRTESGHAPRVAGQPAVQQGRTHQNTTGQVTPLRAPGPPSPSPRAGAGERTPWTHSCRGEAG